MSEQQVSSRFAPRSLVGLVTQAAQNPPDLSQPAQQAERMLVHATMASDGHGAITLRLDDGTLVSGTLLTDEPLYFDQTVWASPTSTPGVYGVLGSVR